MKNLVAEIENQLIEIRRAIHRKPELGFEENITSNLIANYLRSLGIETNQGIAKTGVVGLIKGKNNGKTLLIRADIDALPMKEQNCHDFVSENEGVMHACGHDVHTTILLGVANVLAKSKDTFNGNVKLVFQPAEEAMGGALPMIEEGIMENPRVDGAVAYHVWKLPVGTIGIKSGGVTASPDHFSIEITGRGGHGASPEKCINPVEIGSQISTRLNNIKLDKPSVVTICSFNCGTGENIIADTAVLKGTARALDSETRQKLYEMILSVSDEVASSLGGKAEVKYRFLYPPAVNDANMVNMFVKSAGDVIGKDNIIFQEKPDMIGDDFAYFSELVPSCYVKLGGAKTELHCATFDVDESCIKTGVEIMLRFVLDFLKND